MTLAADPGISGRYSAIGWLFSLMVAHPSGAWCAGMGRHSSVLVRRKSCTLGDRDC